MATSGSENFVNADRPPDPLAAAESVREARRRLVASAGIIKAFLGLLYFAAFGTVLATMEPSSAAWNWIVAALLAGFVAMQAALPPIVWRIRRSHGITAVAYAEAEAERIFSSGARLALLLVLGGAAALVLATIFVQMHRHPSTDWTIWSAGFDAAVSLICTFGLASLFAVRYLRLGFWEDLLMAAGVTVAGVLFACARDVLRLEAIAMIAAAAAFVSGVSLHRRWRRWVRDASAESADATRQGSEP